jgi:hypothetical protein
MCALMPATAAAFDLEETLQAMHPQYEQHRLPDLGVMQGCMSLDEAIERVRRRGDVERILSAETRGDTHHIRYLTKDGKVKTQKFRSC